MLLFSAALFPMWFVSSLYLQQVLGLSPLHAGLTFLPMTLMIMIVASRAGKLVSRFGVRAVLGGGLMMMTAGMLLFTKIARQRQRDRVRDDPGAADRGGDRDVDRPLDDRRHPGGQGGPDRPRLGTGQHLAPDRRRARARGPDHARHPAHDAADRPRPQRPGGADRRLPARVPDRRVPDRRGRGGDVRDGCQGPCHGVAIAPAAGARRRRARASSRSSPSTSRSAAPTAPRSAPTRRATPTASCPSRACIRRSRGPRSSPRTSTSCAAATSSWPTSTT